MLYELFRGRIDVDVINEQNATINQQFISIAKSKIILQIIEQGLYFK